MINPLNDTKFDTVWNMHDLMNDLIYELNMTRGNFVSEIAQGLDNSSEARHILNVLEYYDTLVLEEVQYYMKKYSTSLFELIQKRRMAYVEKVRSMRCRNFGGGASRIEKRFVHRYTAPAADDDTIDLSRDQDDTANLAYGMEVIGRGIDKIDRIIQKKQYLIEQKKRKESLRWWGMFSTFVVGFTLAYIIVSTFYKI
jgi:hypothetical protein